MRKLTVSFLLVLIAFILFIPGVGATDREYNNTPAEDGLIRKSGAVYTRFNSGPAMQTGRVDPVIDRGYMEIDISGLPNITITDIMFYYDGLENNNDSRIVGITIRPSISANNTLFWAIGNGTIYADPAGFPVVGDQQVVTLNGSAIASLQAALTAGQTWWAIGFISEDEVGAMTRAQIAASEHATPNPVPTIFVGFQGNYTYVFDGGYYENGTDYGLINVEYSTPTDDGDFNVNGSTTKQFNVEPELFYWDIDGGLARYIYSFGSENFTVLMPEDTFYTYGFTIKDYTGKSGIGDAYLEAWRAFGAETLVERMKIIQPNPTPLNLVFGKTYHLYILWADGTRYDWGYFLAGSDTSNTIIARSTTFTDQAHMIYQTIRVEATRSADGGTITVDYNDTRDNTVWANVTITQRGGGVMLQATRNNSTYTLNWASANTSLGYIVAVTGEHGDYGEWGYVMVFDPTETFPATPSLTGIFDVGLGANLGGWVITVAAMLGFSKTLKTRALLVGSAVATLLNYIGFASWTINQLIFAWFFSIVVALAGGSE